MTWLDYIMMIPIVILIIIAVLSIIISIALMVKAEGWFGLLSLIFSASLVISFIYWSSKQ